MNILYDLIATQPNEKSKFHGGGEYGKVVFEHLVKHKKNNKIFGLYNKKRYFDEKIMAVAAENKINLIHVDSKKDIQKLITSCKYDKFYSALPYGYYDLTFDKTQFIFTIHGLRNIEMPTDRYEKHYNKGIIKRLKFIYKNLLTERYKRIKREQFEKIINVNASKKIIVPSQHTKYSLLNCFPNLDPNELIVLYSPRKVVEVSKEVDLEKYGVQKSNYFLLISGDRWIKNAYRAVKALDNIFTMFSWINQNVLVLGVKDKRLYLNNISNHEKFNFHGYVEEYELEHLYKNAYCFIYPTLNEGFGYPPLESMKYGTPVISSAITSITEICRDGVIYFNPFSVEELQNRILYLLTDKEAWQRYSERGLQVSREVSTKQDMMLDELVKFILS